MLIIGMLAKESMHFQVTPRSMTLAMTFKLRIIILFLGEKISISQTNLVYIFRLILI